MFWAACSLGYFGFLRASEFTVPTLASFSPSFHLGVDDIAVDSSSAPTCMVEVPGPLFLFQNGRPLSRALLTDWLRQTLASANIPGNFSSHSFRIGAATVAARNGVPDHLIQALGRWSSSAYQLYIRTPSESLAALSTKLAVPR